MDLSPLSSITRGLEPRPESPRPRMTWVEFLIVAAIHCAVAAVAFGLGWFARGVHP